MYSLSKVSISFNFPQCSKDKLNKLRWCSEFLDKIVLIFMLFEAFLFSTGFKKVVFNELNKVEEYKVREKRESKVKEKIK